MIVKHLGPVAYDLTLEAMRAFTAARDEGTADEVWLCEHPPVFTQGLAGRAAHVHDVGAVPVVQTDRGGQVTYHGPGQVVAYPLVDLRRLRIYVKEYVYRLERAVLMCWRTYGVTGHRVPGAPGVFVRLDEPSSHRRCRRRRRRSFAGLGRWRPWASRSATIAPITAWH